MKQHRLRALVAAAVVTLPACGGHPNKPTPPGSLQLSCPTDVTVSGVIGTSQEVSFPLPTSSGGSPPVNISCNPGTGSPFKLGTTPVTCTATDAASRQAMCALNVTLVPVPLSVSKFVAFGDSVTEGENGLALAFALTVNFVDKDNAYPKKLDTLLNTEFPNQGMIVVNEGKGGERIEQGELRLPTKLAQDQPGALLLLEGYNNLTLDCAFGNVTIDCGSDIETVAGKLRECVRIARGAPYNLRYVFVGTLTPPGLSGSRRIDPSAITKTNEKIRKFIPGEGGVVVDLFGAFSGHEGEYVGPDGLHLNPSGNQAIADTFFAAIKAAVPQSPPPTTSARP